MKGERSRDLGSEKVTRETGRGVNLLDWSRKLCIKIEFRCSFFFVEKKTNQQIDYLFYIFPNQIA